MYKVFIADDEPFIIEGLYDIVDWPELGMEIVGQAENGMEALEALRLIPADILITDISMPKMDGLNLIRAVRDIQPDLKVIVLSGYDEFAYLKEGMALGIENYLLKPINIQEFKATLHTVAEKLNVTQTKYPLHEHSIQILRDNVLHRLLMNQINPQEFQERADVLGISLHEPYVLVSVLRCQHSNQEMYDTIGGLLKDQQGILSFRDMDGDIVLLYNFDDPVQARKEADLFHQGILNLLSAYLPLRLSLGTVEEITEAPRSYTYAKKAQEYFMIWPDQDIIRYDDLKEQQAHDEENLSLNWNDYVKLIMAGEKERLFARVEQDFLALQQTEGITPDLLQAVAMEWTIRFKMQLEEIRHVDEAERYTDNFNKIRSTASFHELIGILKDVAEITVDSLVRDVKSPVIHQVLNHIKDAYNEDISLKTLGALYNIHPVYLGQLFHKEVNETFTDYINGYRIERAKELLKHSRMKVQEIARAVGYWETGYFNKQFKKYVGISPTEYKGLGQ